MAATAKLKLLLELGNKLFNNKLMQTKRKLSKTTDKMRGKLKQLKLSTTSAFSAMRAEVPLFGRAMDLLGNPYTLIAAGLLGVVMLFGKATGEAKKFNHEFLQIKQLNLDKNNKDLKTYKGLIMDTAFETGKGLTDTTKAYYDIQSALGFYGKDAATIFKSVAKFSTATGADLNDSINATSKAIKAFGLNANDTDMLLSSNAKTVQVGITTFKELAKVQTEYAGAAAGAGQKVDSANKLFAVFTSIAKDSQQAATLTKTAFQGLTQAATVKGLKSIGVEIYDASGNLRSMESILVDVDKKFKKMSPKQIDELINKIGGSEGLRAMLTKVKNGAEDMFKTFEAFDASNFDLDKALKNAQGDVTVLSAMVSNRFNVVMAKLGEKILPLVLRVVEKMNVAITWVYTNFDLLEDIVESLAIGFGVLGLRLLFFKGIALASAIASGGLAGALGFVTAALHGIKLAIFSIPIVGWILLAVTAVVLLYKRWDKFRAFVQGFGEIAKLVIGKIVDGFVGLGEIIKGIWDWDYDAIKNGAKKVGKAFEVINPMSLKNGAEYAKAFKTGYNKEMDKSAAAKELKAKNKNLLAGDDASTTKTTNDENGGNTDNGLGKVTKAASAPKSIIIEKIVLNQGGINTTNTTLAHKSPEEIEEWMTEAFMRVVRAAETS